MSPAPRRAPDARSLADASPGRPGGATASHQKSCVNQPPRAAAQAPAGTIVLSDDVPTGSVREVMTYRPDRCGPPGPAIVRKTAVECRILPSPVRTPPRAPPNRDALQRDEGVRLSPGDAA